MACSKHSRGAIARTSCKKRQHQTKAAACNKSEAQSYQCTRSNSIEQTQEHAQHSNGQESWHAASTAVEPSQELLAKKDSIKRKQQPATKVRHKAINAHDQTALNKHKNTHSTATDRNHGRQQAQPWSHRKNFLQKKTASNESSSLQQK